MNQENSHVQEQTRLERQDVPGVVPADATAVDNVSPEEYDEDQKLIRRIEQLPSDVGWLLVYIGALGFVIPGFVGLPILLAGAAVIIPGGPKWIARLMGSKPPRFMRGSMKQLGRLLDDLDRRYPPLPKINS
jgi:hypothetical protein